MILEKRVAALEQATGKNKPALLFIDRTADGGLVHDGRFFPDDNALLVALGHGPDDNVLLLAWRA